MDQYLSEFFEYLKIKFSNNLAGIIAFGSYGKAYFDKDKSDYDLLVVFKDQVKDIRDELLEQFPRLALHFFGSLEGLKTKTQLAGWKTYIVFVYTGLVLFETKELISLRKELEYLKPNISRLSSEQKKALINKMKTDTMTGLKEDGYKLNKFFHPSLLRKLQIIHFIRTEEIILDFNELIKTFSESFIKDNLEWLIKLQDKVYSRSEELVAEKSEYFEILEAADEALAAELITD